MKKINYIKQKGAATLFVVVVLLVVMAVLALMVGRKGLMEQQMTGNDLRSKEVQEAAEAGIEFGVAYAAANVIPWPAGGNPNDPDVWTCPGGAGCPAIANIAANQTSSGETYAISSLTFSRASDASEYIRITATANGGAGGGENTIEATSMVYIKPGGLLTSNATLPPPLVMSGCMTQTTGTPDIYPGTNGLAILTSQPETTNGGNLCLDHCGPGGGNNNACQNPVNGSFAHLNINGGTLSNDVAFPDWDGDGSGTTWEYYFDVPIETYQQYASNTLSEAGGAYYITNTDNQPGNRTYGSLDNPAIIVFENGCPKFNGNTTIYGIVFFRDENACVSGGMNGWGNVTIYGSIGVTGGVHQLNANIEIHGVGSGAGLNVINQIPINASKLPGTWNDFI